MTAGSPATSKRSEVKTIIDEADSSLLDLVDHILDKGVVLTGEVILGLAEVDLIYLRLSALLCAADRVLPNKPKARP